MDEAAKNILKTIIWFDLFEYPLSKEDFLKYCANNTDLETKLKELVDKKLIENKAGFYFLPGREKIVETRKEREIESERKLKRAKKAAKFLGILPFIKAVVVCNVLGYKNAKTEDDIDFLIITAPGRIWTARFFATGFFKVLNLRPNKKTIKDKFCFSFYLAEDGLNLEKIKLPDDPYLIWWFAGLIPLYAAEGVFEKFLRENEWVKDYLPNFNNYTVIPGLTRDPEKRFLDSLPRRQAGGSRAGMTIKKICQFIASLFPEKLYQKFQLWVMPKQLKEMANKNPGVIITDKILKFHLVDRRADFAEKYSQIVNKISTNL